MIALDTNILAYAVADSDAKGRHGFAVDLLAKLAAPGAIVPLPVFGEFLNACRKKKILNPQLARARVEMWASLYDCPAPVVGDYLRASSLAAEQMLQYFDTLIITVAARAGATMLLSEDMQDGLEVAGLRVVNPFVAANDALLADFLGSAA